jgi:hypothetical protein
MKGKIIIIGLILGSLIGANVLWGESFFFKAGAGAGYDSNLFSDRDAIAGIMGTLKIQGEGIFGEEPLQFYGGLDLYAELNQYYTLLDGKAGAGLIIKPNIYSIIKAVGSYQYYMNVFGAVEAMAEFKGDLTPGLTGGVKYELRSQGSLSGSTNETYINHGFKAGVFFDITDFLLADISVNGGLRTYTEVIPSAPLGNNMIGGTAAFILIPDYNTDIKAGYSFANYSSSRGGLTVFSTTNMLYTYNNATLHSVFAELDFEISLEWSVSLLGRVDFIYLPDAAKSETAYIAGIRTDIFIDPSVKLEIPVVFSGLASEVAENYNKLRVNFDINFLL